MFGGVGGLVAVPSVLASEANTTHAMAMAWVVFNKPMGLLNMQKLPDQYLVCSGFVLVPGPEFSRQSWSKASASGW